ncbi:MAG: hypothetical protein ACJAW7_002579 [Candidatus Azotimanducaceae bacterium]|jgi:hypothetical protein
MPLRAILNKTDLFAFEQTPDSWEELKSSQQRAKLVMPCCGERAVAKTSPLGNFFFSHYRRSSECQAKPESKEHLFLKDAIAKAAKATGWDVITEYPGSTPDGDGWVADVYCRNKMAHIAFEVQLSKQSIKEFNYRQERYKKSGVRAAWFVSETVHKSINSVSSKDLPVFLVREYAGSTPSPIISQFDLPLDKFIRSLLSGEVSWVVDPEELSVYYIQDTCWSCGKPVRQPYGHGIDVYYEHVKTVPNCSTVLNKILDYVGNESLASHGINRISSYPNFKGNAPNFPYCAECIHCGQPQANCFLMEKLEKLHREEEECAESFIIGTCNGRWEYKC